MPKVTVICWNCDKTGHRHRLCPEPKRRFCYRCRGSGVTKRDCPHCNKCLKLQNDTEIIDFANSVSNKRQVAFCVDFTLAGREIRALLDSGASKSFLGQTGIELIKNMGLTAKPILARRVTVANESSTDRVTVCNGLQLLSAKKAYAMTPIKLEALWKETDEWLRQDIIEPSSAEKNYTVTELELITDHSSLRWLHNLKNTTGRLARWALELLDYDLTIIHRKGVLQNVPDALSRIPEQMSDQVNQIEVIEDRWYLKRLQKVEQHPGRFPNWKIEDNRLYYHKPADFPETEVTDLNAWKLGLYRERRLKALQENHSTPQSGHLRVEKTHRRIATQYYWPSMFKDVVSFVRHCEICHRTKVEQIRPAGFMVKKTVEEPWTIVATDIMGPLTPSSRGNVYILIIQNLYTKWIEIQPLRKATSLTTSTALQDLVINRWGSPKVLLTDNGTEFINNNMKALATKIGFRHMTTPPYRPQADPVERVNRVVRTMIIAFIERSHREWDLHLPEFRFAHNTAYHTSIQSILAFLNFGREPTSAISLRRELERDMDMVHQSSLAWSKRMQQLNELRNSIVHALDSAFQKQSHYYNCKQRDQRYEIGDLN
ncbi:uncharacterized protein LOC122509251 [Leptopilina heterotoma]|uniref:uncharacterized protein LOC122509251 n=1 Tax=Leptopilina heterotoma TaxID=63436 RepID=UPI001CA9AF2C|nr:uncharacterized protein LOC122509251 [Leptopilina heterotoma]